MNSGEPPITRRAVHDSGSGNKPPRRVVIHATCPGVGYPAASKKGAASGTAKYFQMQSSGGSAHYVYDSSRREEHCVPESVTAWHAPPNQHSIGIEICGEASYTREQWLSDKVWPAVEEAAARTRELCLRYRLPMRRLTVTQVRAGAEGVCGHVDVSQAFRQTDHTDPGPNFPWDEFMQLVNNTEDDVSAKDTWDHELKVPFGKPDNPEWQAGNILVNTAKWVYELRQAIGDLEAKVDALKARLDEPK